jgi:hypothetical protein
MRRVFVAISGLLLLAIVVQVFAAGMGAFDQPRDDDSFAMHRALGNMVIPLLAILAIVAAALAKAPGRLIGLAAAPLGLTVVQILIVVLGRAVAGGKDSDTSGGSLAIPGLHAVNALFMMGVAITVMRRARALAEGSAATPASAG